jgi:hypothetical protein
VFRDRRDDNHDYGGNLMARNVLHPIRRLGKAAKVVKSRWRYAQAHGAGSLPRQLRDIRRFHRLLGTREQEYYDYRLYDDGTPLDERLTILSEAFGYGVQLALNPRPAWSVVKNKSRFAAAMQAAEIPTPPILGVLDTKDGLPGMRAAMQRIHDNGSAARDGLVIKPESGSHMGRGVWVFRAFELGRDGHFTFTAMSGQAMTDEALMCELLAGIKAWDGPSRRVMRYLIQPRLVSDESVRGFNPYTLCTMRVVTLRESGGNVHVLGATYKLGVGRKGTDNYNDGGIAVALDVVTGTLGSGVRKGDDTVYTAHPDTGISFTGVTLPFWGDALQLAQRAAAAVPQLPTLGWDVALTPVAPCIIEANPDWGLNIVQRPQQRGIWRPPLQTAYEQLQRVWPPPRF